MPIFEAGLGLAQPLTHISPQRTPGFVLPTHLVLQWCRGWNRGQTWISWEAMGLMGEFRWEFRWECRGEVRNLRNLPRNSPRNSPRNCAGESHAPPYYCTSGTYQRARQPVICVLEMGECTPPPPCCAGMPVLSGLVALDAPLT